MLEATKHVGAVDLPLFKGAKRRHRRLPAATKAEAHTIAKTTGLRISGSKLMKLVQRFKHLARGIYAGGCNAWDRAEGAAYLDQSRKAWRSATWTTVCTAWDATRLNKQERLWTAFTAPQADWACWGTPGTGLS